MSNNLSKEESFDEKVNRLDRESNLASKELYEANRQIEDIEKEERRIRDSYHKRKAERIIKRDIVPLIRKAQVKKDKAEVKIGEILDRLEETISEYRR